jgi:2-keto-4-pentenoate hydratase
MTVDTWIGGRRTDRSTAAPQLTGYAVVGDGSADPRSAYPTAVERLTRQVLVEDCATVPGDGANLFAAAHLAFVLRSRLGPGARATDVLRATAAVLPALRISAAGTVACVLGDAVLVPGDVDDLLVTTKRDGVVVAAGEPTDMWLPPVAAVAWLAAELYASGDELCGGLIVLSGALHRAVPVPSGSHVRADMLAVGSVCAHLGG